MAVKRKAVESAAADPQKRSRFEETTEDWPSDDSGDYQVNYTDNGTLRADSEARRQWHYVCEVEGCGQRFNRPCRLEAHMRSHNKERPFACTEPGCDKNFPRKDHLQRHVKNAHNPVAARTFTCAWEGCGKSFTSNGRLQRHQDVHDSKFYCTDYPPCNHAFRTEKTLTAHVKSDHLAVKPYACTLVDAETGETCTHGYQQEAALHRHIAKAHAPKPEGVPDAGHFCMICIPPGTETETIQTETGETTTIPKQPLSFASADELAAHTLESHPPVCSECGQKFKNPCTLKSHFDTVHADPADQPRFPCPKPDCDNVFTRKHNLTVHIQAVHDKMMKYFCTADSQQASKHADLLAWHGENACGAAFKVKSSLDQHIRTHHLGLQNRKEARRAAKSKKKTDPSMLTLLTGVGYEKGRDVPCLVATCEYRFYMDRDLRRHLRAAHNMSDEDVDERIGERDALTGGQFWIGGLDDPMFESVDPSMPQTPTPYFTDAGMAVDAQHKAVDPRLAFFDQLFVAEDADMDRAMGLEGLEPATDVQAGLGMEMLYPVEQYNMGHAREQL
ncbi:hypothetical protein P153DRAFT_311123 [Dothidotthia symphoricarpi CBS 119687]|uniref:C2H2-type domain-containing protein n=1 Tax=Dothidotthia symphoricarpi CBS 119687 TaxID=1392245 RepID=A0A6A6AN25_9PLEO|nr:uncharacterized protein P153DRAFT_311123 [Dothidotthia symphoricarpi CBS 119687]KAF2132287.1 hypothetical protein P153DRAFT_311123 [Dothidotthia symphoricarpi CBS 119687]